MAASIAARDAPSRYSRECMVHRRTAREKIGREDKSAQMYTAFGWRLDLLARMSCSLVEAAITIPLQRLRNQAADHLISRILSKFDSRLLGTGQITHRACFVGPIGNRYPKTPQGHGASQIPPQDPGSKLLSCHSRMERNVMAFTCCLFDNRHRAQLCCLTTTHFERHFSSRGRIKSCGFDAIAACAASNERIH